MAARLRSATAPSQATPPPSTAAASTTSARLRLATAPSRATPPPGGGSLANFNAASVKNSIVGNSSGGNCYGTITASGANLDTDGSCRSISFTTVTPAQLNLGPLALNPPGTTATQALLPGSAAINAATNCTDVSGNSVTTDQRGVARPDNGESACDIGAFELVDRTLLASFSAKLSLQFNQGAINLNSAFTLGAGSDGIFPLTED